MTHGLSFFSYKGCLCPMKRVMKRALADRAKLDLPQGSGGSVNGAASPPSETTAACTPTNPNHENGRIGFVSSPVEGPPPLKLQRIASEEPPSVREQTPSISVPLPKIEKSEATVSSSSVPPSPRIAVSRPDIARSHQTSSVQSSNKRIRKETSSNHSLPLSSEQENDSSSAFYLQHQNRALAVELKSLQAQVRELAQEREHRRKSCLQALQALHSLQATWTSLETALGQETSTMPSSTSTSSPSDMPTSTAGDTNETSVEWTAALHNALQALGNQSRPATSGDNSEDRDSPTADEDSPSSSGQREMRSLGVMAANITGRANCLQEWLWKVLYSKGMDLPKPNVGALQQRTDLESEIERLKAQTVELMQSLDDMGTRERRLRRNIYRLDVGMITQKQLIQSVVAGTQNVDEDPERLAVQKEAVLKGSFGGDIDSSKAEMSDGQGPGPNGSVSASVVAGLQRELQDSRQEVANREKSIDEVRLDRICQHIFFLWHLMFAFLCS